MERASYDQSFINLNNEEKIYTFGINDREFRLHAGICQWMGEEQEKRQGRIIIHFTNT